MDELDNESEAVNFSVTTILRDTANHNVPFPRPPPSNPTGDGVILRMNSPSPHVETAQINNVMEVQTNLLSTSLIPRTDTPSKLSTKLKRKHRKKPRSPPNKCGIRKCLLPSDNSPTKECDAEGCEKLVHESCYVDITRKSKTAVVISGKVFHSIACQKKYKKNYSTQKLTWKNDGKDGKDDKKTSEYFLLDWLSRQGNLDKWREPGNGMTKIQLCAIISQWLVDQGVLKTHIQDQVKSKLGHIERSMRQQFDWETSVTGAGILEADGEMTFRQTIIERCYYYFDLKDVFADRAGFVPSVTNKTNLLFSSDEEANDTSLDEDEDEDVGVYDTENEDKEIADNEKETTRKADWDDDCISNNEDDEDEFSDGVTRSTRSATSTPSISGRKSPLELLVHGAHATPSARMTGSGKKRSISAATKKSRKRKGRSSTEPSLDQSLSQLIQLKVANMHKPRDKVGDVIRLAKQFKELSDALD